MKTYQILVSRPRYEEPYSWRVLELGLTNTTARLDDIKRDVRKFIAESDTPHETEFDIELFVRFDPDAAREVHHGAVKMCKLLGFRQGERSHSSTEDHAH